MPPCETLATKALSASEKESAALAAIADERIKIAALLSMEGRLQSFMMIFLILSVEAAKLFKIEGSVQLLSELLTVVLKPQVIGRL
jgi:hypothetical protein